MAPPAATDKQRVFSLLSRHGFNSTSFQVLESGFSYWFCGDDACVAYADTGGAWVVAGAPIAALAAWPSVITAFLNAAHAAQRRVTFFAVERRFLETTGFVGLQIGEQPVWDPATWPDTVATSASLRQQLRRAGAKGVTVRRLAPALLDDAASDERRAIERLIERWRRTRGLAPMGFLVRVEPFVFSDARHYFAAYVGEALVGFVSMVPVYARQGWFIDDLLRDPQAPNGTVELLVDAAMRDAASLASRYVTLGLAPLSGGVGGWLRGARRVSRGLYDFGGLRAFKAKLRPTLWEPIFAAMPPGHNTLRAVYDILVAFTPRGVWHFLWDTLRRGPTVLVQLLTLLLIPWTVALACTDAATWFPSGWVKAAWVGFDVLLFAGLAALCQRWRPTLATALACAITADAALTAVEAVLFAQPEGVLGAVVRAAAVLAPASAAAVLWAARARRRAL